VISVKKAARLIREGGVVAYPTETAYGLGADALNEEAVKKIYELKGRTRRKKLPVIVPSLDSLAGHAYVNGLGKYLSRHFHPGPLSIMVNSEHYWLGAFRVSSSPVAGKLAELAGPITATSANRSGMEPPFAPGDVGLDVPVVRGPRLDKGPVSTVYDPFTLRVVRRGAVPENEIKRYVVAFQALERVRPGEAKARKVTTLAREVLEIVRGSHPKAVLGGSVAKGTFTRDLGDIDVFLLFPKDADLEGKLDFLKGVARKLGEPEVSYAQHPYVKVKHRGVEVELVPAHDTGPGEVISATDRSRWHVDFVRGLPGHVLDEILVFKQFCRGVGVYGADSKVEGLSAYAMEVLVARHGSFVGVLEALAGTEWPVALPDPVDAARNVLASVSDASFSLLREAAREYLKDPGERFFFPRAPPKLKNLPRLRNKFLVRLERPEMVEEAVWGWAKGVARKLERNAELDGYVVRRWSAFVGGEVLLAFEVFPGQRRRIATGPPTDEEKHAGRFKEANPDWFEQGGRLYALRGKRFGSFAELAGEFAPGAEVLGGGEIRRLKGRARRWLTGFLLEKRPWEY
jgi:tRNA nucleotidyltransferase (CCA-adding enzyme)